MKIKALQDFSYFYMGFTKAVKSGEVIEVENKLGNEFIQKGLAEEVEEEVEEIKEKKK